MRSGVRALLQSGTPKPLISGARGRASRTEDGLGLSSGYFKVSASRGHDNSNFVDRRSPGPESRKSSRRSGGERVRTEMLLLILKEHGGVQFVTQLWEAGLKEERETAAGRPAKLWTASPRP